MPTAGNSTPIRWTSLTPCVVGLMLLVAIAYSPALRGPWIFDDVQTIEKNVSIRNLWPLSIPLHPPRYSPVTGRPVANYSFALDYGLNTVMGIDQSDDSDNPDKTTAYHVTNLLIHILSGLLLFGIIRRTVREGAVPSGWAEKADTLAFFVAGIWMLHPLQTEAVDYLTQRTELLVSLCYLATLYASIRAWDAARSQTRIRWYLAGIAACALGMASKEVMVSAPLMILLYDRAFRASSWKDVFAASGRRWYYAGLAGTLILLAVLLMNSPRGGSAGFNLGIPWYEYLHSQGWAIAHYLRLVVWPVPLLLDYGTHPIPHWHGLPGIALLTVLLAFTCYGWSRVARWGWLAFLGAWFFLLLAPSSSVLPIATEIAAERRIYLPLAAVLVAAGVGCIWVIERLRLRRAPAAAMTLALMVILAAVTFQRSRIYQNHEAIWRDVLAKMPENARAWNNLGVILGNLPTPRLKEADSLYHRALEIDPQSVGVMNNLAITAVGQHDYPAAARWYSQVLAMEPENRAALTGISSVLMWSGDTLAALPTMERLSVLQPTPELLVNLGALYQAVGRSDDAVATYERVRAQWPERSDLMVLLGGTLLDHGRPDVARRFLDEAVARQPDSPMNLALLSVAYSRIGQSEKARQAADRAVALASNDPVILLIAGKAMLENKRADLAEPYLARAVALQPADTDAVDALGKARAELRTHTSRTGHP